MMSLFLKLLTLPPLFVLSAWLLPSVDYGSMWAGIITVAVLIATGIPMEKLFLSKKTFWFILGLDFLSSAFLIWLVASLFNQTEVMLAGVFFLATFIAFAEYFVHQFMLIKEKPMASTL